MLTPEIMREVMKRYCEECGACALSSWREMNAECVGLQILKRICPEPVDYRASLAVVLERMDSM